jgi:hypothetical protein
MPPDELGKDKAAIILRGFGPGRRTFSSARCWLILTDEVNGWSSPQRQEPGLLDCPSRAAARKNVA